jgi:iron complex outermembrane receptor protein
MTAIKDVSGTGAKVGQALHSVDLHRKLAGRTAGIALTAALMGGSSLPAVAQTQAQATAPSGQALEEIVVTAQKVEEKLQNVPVVVTAFSPTQIADQHIETVQDLGLLVPNFYAIEESGSANAPIYTLRGITTPQFSFQLDSGIGIYLDGVYLGRDLGTQFEAADIQRIEVLNGPQGTLFGRNTTGGAINYVTAAPKGELAVHEELSFGNFGKFRTKTVINFPEIDGLSGVVSYVHDQFDGYVKNLAGGTVINYGPATQGRFGSVAAVSEFGSDDTDAFYTDLRYRNDFLTIDYKFDYTEDTAAQQATQTLGFSPGAGGAFASLIFSLQPSLGGGNIVSLSRLGAVSEPFQGPTYDQIWGNSFTTTYDANDWLTIKNIVAYREFHQTNIGSEFDGNTLYTPPGFGLGPGGSLFTFQGTLAQRDQHQVSEELQFIGKMDAFDWQAGVFYFDEQGTQYNPYFLLRSLPNNTLGPLNRVTDFNDNAYVDNSSVAFYAQGTWHATDMLDLTAGVRQTWDNRYDREYDLAGPAVQVFDPSYSDADWQALAEYHWTGDLMTYIKAGTGHLSGGTYHGTPFSPEHIITYEAGLKSEFLDNRIRFNADAFYSDYHDRQIEYYNGVVHFLNAGHEFIKGVEAELDVIPIEHARLFANFGFNHEDTNQQTVVISGTEVQVGGLVKGLFDPEMTISTGFQYDFPDLPFGGHVQAEIDAQYRSKVFSQISSNEAGASVSPALEAVVDPAAFWMLNARVALVDLPLGNTTAKISLWGKNLTNVQEVEYGVDSGFTIDGHFMQPRTYGIDVAIDFGGSAAPASAPAAYVPPPVVAPAPSVPHSYLVFFDFNKSDLTAQAVTIVDQAAANAGPAKVTQLTVTGHTDTVGSDAYNMRLSRRRAESVAAQLEKDGIASSEIEIVAKGKRDLLVPTADGVKEPQNRRVQIVYSGGPTS